MSQSLSVDSKKILLLESHETYGALVRGYLKASTAEQFVVQRVSDFQEALTAVADNQYDLTLLDHSFGPQGGLCLIQKAIEHGSIRPIVVLADSTEQQLDIQALQMGATDFIAKQDLTADILLKTIRYSLQRHASHFLLHQQAKYDFLTKVSNRQFFTFKLKQSIEDAKENQSKFALMFLDLDGFKNINDTLGHETGDLLLKLVARRILGCIRNADRVGRIGGDEFTVLFEDAEEGQGIDHLVQRVIDKVSKPYDLDGKEVFVGASAGVAFYPKDGKTPNALLRSADHAMYTAKSNERNSYQFFSKKMHIENRREEDQKQRVRTAFKEGALKLFYQPVFDLQKNQPVELEALVRWDHGGLVTTAETFLKTLKTCDWLDEFTRWVFQTSTKQLIKVQRHASRAQSNPVSFDLCLNLTERELLGFKDPQKFLQWMGQNNFDLHKVCIELDERVVSKHLSVLAPIITSLKENNIRISLDHFGKGSLNLWQLKDLPIDQIKIDASICKESISTKKGKVVLESLIQLTHQLGIRSVVTGIETKDQLEQHLQSGCAFGQGYYLCSPLDEKEILTHLAHREFSSKIGSGPSGPTLKPRVVVADDDPGDRLLIQKAIFDTSFVKEDQVYMVKNGEEILHYFQTTTSKELPMPSLVILDLNMPDLNGIAVLQALKRNPRLERMPVVIFTTSDEDEEKKQCLAAGARGFFRKPDSYEKFVEIFKNLGETFLFDQGNIVG